MVTVRTITPDGTLSEPHAVEKVVLTDAEWKARLTPEAIPHHPEGGHRARVLWRPAEQSRIGDVRPASRAACRCFKSNAKFESGTGWPSFYQPVVAENVMTHDDSSFGMTRTEINCARCDAHLGHVFDDGPPPDRPAILHERRGVALREGCRPQVARRADARDPAGVAINLTTRAN